MGWERKRGKLHEFNRVLRGARDTSFDVVVGDIEQLRIDPLCHHARFGYRPAAGCRPKAGRHDRTPAESRAIRPARPAASTEGYSILQPRVAIGAVSASATTFSEVFSGHVGLDPYTTAVSDVYQDLFGEGSYVGKGIYDVDAFERALEGRVPDNALLSHDLFEGLFARVGALHRCRSHRRLSQPLPGMGRAAASLGARRLAAAAMAWQEDAGSPRRPRAEHAAGDRALEDIRQPEAKPAAAVPAAAAGGRMDCAARWALLVDWRAPFWCCSFRRTCSGDRRSRIARVESACAITSGWNARISPRAFIRCSCAARFSPISRR